MIINARHLLYTQNIDKQLIKTLLEFMKKHNLAAFVKNAYKRVGGFYELQDPKLYATAGFIAMECLRYFDGSPLLAYNEFIDIMNDEIKGFCVRYLSSLNFGNSVKRRANDLVLCVMSILQDANFVLFNGEKYGFKLSLHGKRFVVASNEELVNDQATLMIGGGIFVDDKVRVSFPYITSPINPRLVIENLSDQQLFSDIPPVYTYRDTDGVLRLKPY